MAPLPYQRQRIISLYCFLFLVIRPVSENSSDHCEGGRGDGGSDDDGGMTSRDNASEGILSPSSLGKRERESRCNNHYSHEGGVRGSMRMDEEGGHGYGEGGGDRCRRRDGNEDGGDDLDGDDDVFDVSHHELLKKW